MYKIESKVRTSSPGFRENFAHNQKKIEEFLSLNLPLDIICTSHGVIWRENPAQIV